MTVRPAPPALDRPAAAAVAKAAWPIGLPLCIGARAVALDPALLRWEVAAAVRQRCARMSPDRLAELALVVNELAVNAIRYGGGGLVNVTVAALEDSVSVRVYDAQNAAPVVRDPDFEAESGRGLHLVAALTGDRWGYRPTPGGKFVWALITYDLPPEATAGSSHSLEEKP